MNIYYVKELIGQVSNDWIWEFLGAIVGAGITAAVAYYIFFRERETHIKNEVKENLKLKTNLELEIKNTIKFISISLKKLLKESQEAYKDFESLSKKSLERPFELHPHTNMLAQDVTRLSQLTNSQLQLAFAKIALDKKVDISEIYNDYFPILDFYQEFYPRNEKMVEVIKTEIYQINLKLKETVLKTLRNLDHSIDILFDPEAKFYYHGQLRDKIKLIQSEFLINRTGHENDVIYFQQNLLLKIINFKSDLDVGFPTWYETQIEARNANELIQDLHDKSRELSSLVARNITALEKQNEKCSNFILKYLSD